MPLFKQHVFYLVFACLPFTGLSQIYSTEQLIDSAKYYRAQSTAPSSNQKKFNELFALFLQKLIRQEPNLKNYKIDSLLSMAHIISKDEKLQVFSWSMQQQDFSYKYFCYLSFTDQKGQKTIELKQDPSIVLNDKLAYKKLNAFKWYGAIYFDLLQVKHKKKTTYVLLGIDKSNPLISKKVIEPIAFTSSKHLVLGKALLRHEKRIKRRAVFQYSSDVRYDIVIDKQQLIFSSLAAHEPQYTGQYQYYGPDLSFNAYKWEKDHFQFIKDIDFRGKDKGNPSIKIIDQDDLYKKSE